MQPGEAAANESNSDMPGKTDDKSAMAKYQMGLALDRTMLAWVRTTLSMVGFGFGMTAFFRTLYQSNPGTETRHLHLMAIVFGVALLAIGLITVTFAGLTQLADLRILARGGIPAKSQIPLTLVVTGLLLMLSVFGLVAVLVF